MTTQPNQAYACCYRAAGEAIRWYRRTRTGPTPTGAEDPAAALAAIHRDRTCCRQGVATAMQITLRVAAVMQDEEILQQALESMIASMDHGSARADANPADSQLAEGEL